MRVAAIVPQLLQRNYCSDECSADESDDGEVHPKEQKDGARSFLNERKDGARSFLNGRNQSFDLQTTDERRINHKTIALLG